MKKSLSTCLVLICFMVAVKGQPASSAEKPEIKVTPSSGGIKVSCPDGYKLYKGQNEEITTLPYDDDYSGEYVCKTNSAETSQHPIFVKFRTCDNCVELDEGTVSGLVVGNLVATFVIAVAVYLVASQAQTITTASNKKRSDRQHLVPNEMDNEHYQPLRHKNGQRDVYDRLRK